MSRAFPIVPGLLAMLSLTGCAGTAEVARPATAPALPVGVALVGLAGGEVEGVMGEPSLIRADGTAQYWRYGLGGCQLDLFLYADAAANRPRVAWLDVRPSRGSGSATSAACAELARRLRTADVATAPAPKPLVSEPL